jgi:hypothetical protein
LSWVFVLPFTCVKQTSWLLKETAVFEVVLYDDVGDGIEDELNVGRVRGASEVRVNLFLVSALVQTLKLHLDVSCSLLVSVGAWWRKTGNQIRCLAISQIEKMHKQDHK